MLLRWFKFFMRDELHIFVHPEYVLLTHLKPQSSLGLKLGFKQQVLQQQVLTVNLSEPLNQWNGLKSSLAHAFNSENWQDLASRGISGKVVISSHFARYAVIPWRVDLAVENERQAFMRYRFIALFGDAAKAWDLQMSQPEFGQPTIASGVDASLIKVLQEILLTANVKVKSISPYLMLAINQCLKQIKQQKTQQIASDQNFWFAAVESERLCFALIENGAWRLVKNVATEADLNTQLHTLIQREMINCNINPTLPLVIYQAESEAELVFNIANSPTIQIQSNDFYHVTNNVERRKIPSKKSVKYAENKWQKAHF